MIAVEPPSFLSRIGWPLKMMNGTRLSKREPTRRASDMALALGAFFVRRWILRVRGIVNCERFDAFVEAVGVESRCPLISLDAFDVANDPKWAGGGGYYLYRSVDVKGKK
jgi:hypothetical protein